MDLVKILSAEHTRLQCDKVVDYVGVNELRFNALVEVYLTGPYRITQRAAWPLGICIERHPNLVLPHLTKLLAFVSKDEIHNAVKRNTMRMLQSVEVPKRLRGKVIDLAFKFLQNKKEPVAVRVFSMSVLDNLLKSEPELQKELKIILEDEFDYASAAFRSRAAKIIRKIKN